MIEAAFFTALGICWLMCRLNLRRLAGYAFAVDTAVTGLLTFLFIGTYAGMVTGMFAGLFVSVFLTGVKRTMGYERLELRRRPNEAVARMRWVRYPPK